MGFQTTDCAGHVTNYSSSPPSVSAGYTNIMTGNFAGDGEWEMMAYTQSTGNAIMWVNKSGTFSVQASYSGFRTDWSIISAGEFGANDFGGNSYADKGYTDFLFYSPNSAATIFTSDGSGSLVQLRSFSDWLSTHSMIIPLAGTLY